MTRTEWAEQHYRIQNFHQTRRLSNPADTQHWIDATCNHYRLSIISRAMLEAELDAIGRVQDKKGLSR